MLMYLNVNNKLINDPYSINLNCKTPGYSFYQYNYNTSKQLK